jgi:hypothetical protein
MWQHGEGNRQGLRLSHGEGSGLEIFHLKVILDVMVNISSLQKHTFLITENFKTVNITTYAYLIFKFIKLSFKKFLT